MLFATGTENSGVSFFVQDDRLVLDYNSFNDHTVLVSDAGVPAGPSVVPLEFRRAGPSAPARCWSTGPVRDAEVPFAMLIISSVGPSVGYDHGSPVSARYTGHFPFGGTCTRSPSTWSVAPAAGDAAAGGAARRHVPAVDAGAAGGAAQAVKRAEAPASTSMTEPVMWRAPSEQRKTSAAVISSASSQGTGCT